MSEDPPQKEEPVPDAPQKQQTRSGLTYSLVTKYWPRIAAGLVALAVISEWVVGGLTANGRLEFYVFAWATTTGGLWFLFEKAEKSLSKESRGKVAAAVQHPALEEVIRSLPGQFAAAFDRIFGERHFSRQFFNRSCVASLVAVLVVATLTSGAGVYLGGEFSAPNLDGLFAVPLAMIVPMVVFNFVPDYLSLLETRWAIGWMERSGRMASVLAFDVVATALLSVLGMLLVSLLITAPADLLLSWMTDRPMVWGHAIGFSKGVWLALMGVSTPLGSEGSTVFGPEMIYFVRVSFLSAFFTSIWLWLYAASVLVSRRLLRMNSGIGFLLRASDVERQPFRSMGFVSVLITTLLFAVGLPFVLLG